MTYDPLPNVVTPKPPTPDTPHTIITCDICSRPVHGLVALIIHHQKYHRNPGEKTHDIMERSTVQGSSHVGLLSAERTGKKTSQEHLREREEGMRGVSSSRKGRLPRGSDSI